MRAVAKPEQHQETQGSSPGQQKSKTKSCAEGNTPAISWWLHNKPPTTIYTPRRLSCCHQGEVLLPAGQHLQQCGGKGKKAFDSNSCQQNLSKVSVFTSLLQKYSVDVQISSICHYFEHPFCPPACLLSAYIAPHHPMSQASDGATAETQGSPPRFAPGQQEHLQYLKAFKTLQRKNSFIPLIRN